MDLAPLLPDGLTHRRPALTDAGIPVPEDLEAILGLCRAAEERVIG